ncbi:MAG: Gfo/Idh/MocA family oxidoreductase [Planctomycetes bacterium]|nr:Gfo/Idh/MocA family oxidoreductase [Planctomycetota bacterium]
MADQVRVGFVGCGGNAQGHMRQVAQDPAARIVGVCDVSGEAAAKAAEQFAAQAFSSHKAMLDAGGLDAVYISVPPCAHGEIELDVLDCGLPFFVEKPVALTLELAQRIASRVRESNTLTCVGYQLRYTAAAQATKAFLADRTVGMAVGRYWCPSGRGNSWLQQWAKSGGQVVEQATHTIDMMRFLCGEIIEVYCLQANRTLKAIDCPDHNVLAIKFASGALGALTTCWAFEGWDGNVVDIFFDRYRIAWNAAAPAITPACEAFQVDAALNRSIDKVFIEAVRTGDRSGILTPYEDAVRSLAVSLAANASARAGQPKRAGAV